MIIWGVPGTGKSHFARWLARHQGFTHAETDREVDAVDTALTLAQRGQPVVLEWGMFVQRDTIDIVSGWRAKGADPWWFDGDPRDAAFQAWTLENRRTSRPYPEDLWQTVVGVIDRNWAMVEELFGSARILYTVTAGPVHRPADEIYQLMADRRGAGSHGS
jgi:hypothetical protein